MCLGMKYKYSIFLSVCFLFFTIMLSFYYFKIPSYDQKMFSESLKVNTKEKKSIIDKQKLTSKESKHTII
jgi:hypothetical protein